MNRITSDRSETRVPACWPGRGSQRNIRNGLLAVLLCLALLLINTAPAAAQETRGQILGRVTDPSAAVLVGAQVRAVNMETNVQTSATTNQTGDYSLPFLIPPAGFFLVMDRLYIPHEEERMASHFGEAYADYRGRARRWL